jgi:hypothetical protein
MPSLGIPELLILLLIVLVLGTVSLRQLARGIRSPTPFAGGVIESEVWYFASAGHPSDWQAMLRFGLAWVLLFEIIRRTHRWLRPGTVPLYALAIFLLSPLVWAVTLLVPVIGVENSLRNDVITYYSSPAHWSPDFTAFPQSLGLVGSAVAIVLVSYFILNGSLPSKSAGERTLVAWSGCKGGHMSPAKSQTTRLLCASAFLAGAQFREQILGHFEHESHGTSPELGVDMRLVIMVSQYARIRARRFELYLFLALVAGLIVSLVNTVLGIFVLLLAATAIHFKMTYGERVSLTSRFREENFNVAEVEKSFAVQLDPKVISALPREDQNLIVYKGFTPFVGAGIHLGGWSFVVDISKPDRTIGNFGAPIPFKVEDLYAVVRSGISASHLQGLVIKDFYFVNGREIRADREILPDVYGRPLQCLNHDCSQRYLPRSDTRIRHYMWVRIHDWDQELVTSYFLRFSIRGGTSLFVEIDRFLLTPLSEAYRRIDALAPLRMRDLASMLAISVFAGPVHALFTPFFVLGRLIEAGEKLFGGKERARRKNIDQNLLFDYGAGQGHRQALSSSRYEHFFQKADGDFCTKVLNSIILDRIIHFLDEHHVDTSGLRERKEMILNSGIIVHGGDVKAESLAVGTGAQAIKTFRFPLKTKEKPSETCPA